MGSALHNFVRHFCLLALGWQATAQVYAVVLALMGIAFLVFAQPDPGHASRQQLTLAEQLAPLTELRVWRFSLYYFFVFGAFVALALWLPHYLMDVYSLDIVTAGIITSLYTIPASLFRMLGGWLSDKYGARRVMYWTLIASVVCTFFLSYPPTQYTVKGVGDIHFAFAVNLVFFVGLKFSSLDFSCPSARPRCSNTYLCITRATWVPWRGCRHGGRPWRLPVAINFRHVERRCRDLANLLHVAVCHLQ